MMHVTLIEQGDQHVHIQQAPHHMASSMSGAFLVTQAIDGLVVDNLAPRRKRLKTVKRWRGIARNERSAVSDEGLSGKLGNDAPDRHVPARRKFLRGGQYVGIDVESSPHSRIPVDRLMI
ncbi:MAG: hypothetical protein M9951_17450 [Burkholderiaceae bacterium]|nr:hypothetical protein [Burkholderiaceae bacterium]